MRCPSGCVVRNGLRRFQIADPSNDPERVQRIAAMAKAEGVEEVVIGLTYSISAVHTHAVLRRARRRAGRLRRHGPALPQGPGRAAHASTPCASWRRRCCAAAGERPLELHSHCTIGLAPLVYMEGVQAGFSVVHTAVGPLARGTSQPEALSTARNLEAAGLRARARPRRSRRSSPTHFDAARARQGPARRRAAGVRRRLLPPPAPGRDGHHHAADARGAAPARAVRPGARGGDPRARRDGLSDHRHARSRSSSPARRRAT